MRRIGTPITIRVDDEVLKLAQREAKIKKTPLRTYLRELIEQNFRQIVYRTPKTGAKQ